MADVLSVVVDVWGWNVRDQRIGSSSPPSHKEGTFSIVIAITTVVVAAAAAFLP